MTGAFLTLPAINNSLPGLYSARSSASPVRAILGAGGASSRCRAPVAVCLTKVGVARVFPCDFHRCPPEDTSVLTQQIYASVADTLDCLPPASVVSLSNSQDQRRART